MKDAHAVIVFTGHMIDAPGRAAERFPERIVGAVGTAIGGLLDGMGAGPGDRALCQGACGGDLLFAEAALDRGMRLALVLPCPEDEFIRRSVAFAGPAWTARFQGVRRHPHTSTRLLPVESPESADRNVFAAANAWMLDVAASEAQAAQRVEVIALWNGQRSGKPGGTGGLVEAAHARGWPVHVIDIDALRNGAP